MTKQRYNFLDDVEILTSLLNVLPDAAIILNSDYNLLTYNEKALQMFLLNSEVDIEQEVHKLINPEIEKLKGVFDKKEPLSYNTEYKNKFLNISIYPFNEEHPDHLQFVIFFSDHTNEKISEEAERQKSVQLQRLLDIAQHLNSSLDPIEVLTRIGKESCELLKCYCAIYQLEPDNRTLTPKVVVDPVYHDEIMKNKLDIDNSLTGKSVIQRRSILFNDVVDEDGAFQVPGTSELSNERLIVVPFIMEEEVLGAMCLNRIGNLFTEDEFALAKTFAAFATTAFRNAKHYFDLQHEIAERINTEKTLDANREHLKLINKILRHDIKNHLAVVKSSINLYKNVQNEDYLSLAEERLSESIDLINRMRDLEEFISSNSNLKIYNIENEFKKIGQNFNNLNVTIQGKSRVLADEALESVIFNLFNNALMHGKASEIDVKILREQRFCMVSFADNGIGIPADIKDKVFEENYSFGKTGQSGLGLYIVKTTIERYGGYIYIEDNKPQGTVFNFSLKKVQ